MRKETTICDVCETDVHEVKKDCENIVYDGCMFYNTKIVVSWPPRGADRYKEFKTKELIEKMGWDVCSRCQESIEQYYADEYETMIAIIKDY